MRKALVSAIALALAAGGCTVEVTFNPIGNDVALDGMWLIDGELANADNCAAAGISTVAVAFYDDKGDDFTFDELTFPCSQGTFDTGGPVLAYGSYMTEWFGFDSAGNVAYRGGVLPLVLASPTTRATLATPDFIPDAPAFDPRGTQAEITVDWTINGMVPDATNCASVGIATVEVVFYDEADTGLTNGVVVGMQNCQVGKYDSMPMRVVRAGRFWNTLRARDSAGAIVAESERLMDPLVITTETRVTLLAVDFVGGDTSTLEIMVRWDTNPDPMMMADADCATAGVVTMTYMLTDSGGTLVQMMEDIPCAPTLTFTEPLIMNGTYSLYLEGEDNMGRKLWMTPAGACDGLDVDGGVDSYNCFPDMVMAM